MRIRLKGLNSVTKRLADGTRRTYWYAWKGGPPLRGEPGTPEFIASYNEAVAKKVAPPSGALLALLFRFQESAEFQFGISPRTRRDYIKQIKRIERDFGDFPFKALDDPRATSVFLEWRDKLAQTSLRQADYAYGTLSRILSWAMKRRLIATNPCANGGKLYQGSVSIRSGPTRTWHGSCARRRRIFVWRCCWRSIPDNGKAICCACHGAPMMALRSSCARKRPALMWPSRSPMN
jgi:hypothetical protein